jgi:sortase A
MTVTAAPVAGPARPADADDRVQSLPEQVGYAVRLAIPAISLDTPVKQAGVVQDSHGSWVWQTLPFVAVHYGDLTSMIGARGNAVIAGHVVTLNEGNVFRSLCRVQPDDRIEVWDDAGREHDYHAVDIEVVSPSDTEIMNQTPDETLTLITCGGTFDPIKQEFAGRLIVSAKPLPNHRP